MTTKSTWAMKYLHVIGNHCSWLDHRVLPEVGAMFAAMMSRVPQGGIMARYREVVEKIGQYQWGQEHPDEPINWDLPKTTYEFDGAEWYLCNYINDEQAAFHARWPAKSWFDFVENEKNLRGPSWDAYNELRRALRSPRLHPIIQGFFDKFVGQYGHSSVLELTGRPVVFIEHISWWLAYLTFDNPLVKGQEMSTRAIWRPEWPMAGDVAADDSATPFHAHRSMLPAGMEHGSTEHLQWATAEANPRMAEMHTLGLRIAAAEIEAWKVELRQLCAEECSEGWRYPKGYRNPRPGDRIRFDIPNPANPYNWPEEKPSPPQQDDAWDSPERLYIVENVLVFQHSGKKLIGDGEITTTGGHTRQSNDCVINCDACNGTGKKYPEMWEWKQCKGCEGKGTRLQWSATEPQRFYVDDSNVSTLETGPLDIKTQHPRCEACNGAGRVLQIRDPQGFRPAFDRARWALPGTLETGVAHTADVRVMGRVLKVMRDLATASGQQSALQIVEEIEECYRQALPGMDGMWLKEAVYKPLPEEATKGRINQPSMGHAESIKVGAKEVFDLLQKAVDKVVGRAADPVQTAGAVGPIQTAYEEAQEWDGGPNAPRPTEVPEELNHSAEREFLRSNGLWSSLPGFAPDAPLIPEEMPDDLQKALKAGDLLAEVHVKKQQVPLRSQWDLETKTAAQELLRREVEAAGDVVYSIGISDQSEENDRETTILTLYYGDSEDNFDIYQTIFALDANGERTQRSRRKATPEEARVATLIRRVGVAGGIFGVSLTTDKKAPGLPQQTADEERLYEENIHPTEWDVIDPSFFVYSVSVMISHLAVSSDLTLCGETIQWDWVICREQPTQYCPACVAAHHRVTHEDTSDFTTCGECFEFASGSSGYKHAPTCSITIAEDIDKEKSVGKVRMEKALGLSDGSLPDNDVQTNLRKTLPGNINMIGQEDGNPSYTMSGREESWISSITLGTVINQSMDARTRQTRKEYVDPLFNQAAHVDVNIVCSLACARDWHRHRTMMPWTLRVARKVTLGLDTCRSSGPRGKDLEYGPLTIDPHYGPISEFGKQHYQEYIRLCTQLHDRYMTEGNQWMAMLCLPLGTQVGMFGQGGLQHVLYMLELRGYVAGGNFEYRETARALLKEIEQRIKKIRPDWIQKLGFNKDMPE